MNDKNEAKQKAKHAKYLLKLEKKERLEQDRELRRIKSLDKKTASSFEKRNADTQIINIKRDKKLKKEKNKRNEILKNKGSAAAKKYDVKTEKRRNKEAIKRVNINNSKPKGERLIANSTPEAIIDVQGITKSYTTKSLIFNALEDVSVVINKGEFVAILGPSGSGKSTLLNMISGLDRPTKGSIIIDGVNISALKDSELTRLRRNKVGFVFQSYNLLPTLNVSDNVEIGRSLQKNRSKRLNIDSTLGTMGMKKEAKKRTYELSGGQQQRVSIARALAKQPDILIGDEPTGALDTKSRTEVFKLFQKVNKENKTTIIVVTHNPLIAQLANKVINVRDGKIEKVVINKNPKDASVLNKGYE